MSNYNNLLEITQEPNLVEYSPSKIDTAEDFKEYVKIAVDGYYNKTNIPLIIFDKLKRT
ncbi:hypothetical protein [Aestuariibaculum sediminum]|uniref:hypothetical protein n=1 Tax=Aestuariibaculum sediminum TaxID=2770637 RepID=UPI001CB73471|nr:hypothetical protein [Aestuariibaculum sediminum]